MIAWRITKTVHTSTAMSGQGAKEHGGRWNSKGHAMVYMAATQSLALLEIIVNLASYSLLKRSYSIIQVEFPRKFIQTIPATDLPEDWRGLEHPRLKELGDQWLTTMATPVLQVPSALIPEESNYLINPLHPDFPTIRINDPLPLSVDSRLIK